MLFFTFTNTVGFTKKPASRPSGCPSPPASTSAPSSIPLRIYDCTRSYCFCDTIGPIAVLGSVGSLVGEWTNLRAANYESTDGHALAQERSRQDGAVAGLARDLPRQRELGLVASGRVLHMDRPGVDDGTPHHRAASHGEALDRCPLGAAD